MSKRNPPNTPPSQQGTQTLAAGSAAVDNAGGTLATTWSKTSTLHIHDPLFQPEQINIYCNKISYESFIFHDKIIDYSRLSHIVYNKDDYSLTVFYKNNQTQDLGVKAQWLLRPYIKHAQEIKITRTENREVMEETTIPLLHASPADDE